MACLRGWRASVGDVGGVLALVAWMARLRGWHASVGGVLTWVLTRLRGWHASVGGVLTWVYVVDVLAWVTCQRG